MLLIVVTGGIATGKTYVVKTFEKLNVPIIYADDIAKDLLYKDQNINNQVKQYFNISNLNLNLKNIKIDIFKNKKHRVFLEKLIHPKVIKEIILQIQIFKDKALNSYCIIEIPMLFNLFEICSVINVDKIILVNCYKNLQISRVMRRDKLSKKQVMAIINSQLHYSKLYNIADYILDANKLENLYQEIVNLDAKLRLLSN